MKKLLTILFLVAFLAGNSFAQLINWPEGFEGTAFPPAGWTVINQGDALTWVQYSTNSPHTGTYHAGIHYSSTAHSDYLIAPKLAPVLGNSLFTFWAKNYSTSYIDEFDVLLSTTGTDAADFTVTLASNVAPPTTYTQYTYDLSTYNGQKVYVAVYAKSTDEFYLFVDDVDGCLDWQAPGVATNPTPAPGSTGVAAATSLGWSAPAAGYTPTGYKLFLGTNNPPTNLVNGTNIGNVLTYTPAALNLNTTYYWKVVPTNIAGDATGASVWSFTTLSDTIKGIVTDGITGDPIVGVNVSNGTSSATTGDDGVYNLMTGVGTYTVTFTKVGFQSVTVPNVIVVTGIATVVDAQLYETAIAPAVLTAVVNATDTQCDLTWTPPFGPYEMLYDDGTAENYAAWQLAGNMNAVKFTPAGYPAVVQGGRVFVGDGSFPVGGNFIGQTFKMVVMDDNGTAGMPGTALDSVEVTANSYGWIEFGGLDVTVTSGNFYLTMVQGSVSPNCVPVGVDQTQPTSYKSYSRNVVAGGVWAVSPYQDMMIRAYVAGTVGGGGDNAIAPVKMTPSKFRGMISMNQPFVIPGFEGNATLAAHYNGDAATNYKLYRIGPLADPSAPIPVPVPADLIASPNATSYVDGPPTWAALPMGWYAYAVQAVYPNGDVSPLTYSVKVGHKELAKVTVNVALTTGGSPAGATVTLQANDYPNISPATLTVPASGQVIFPTVWKGTYVLTVHKYGFADAVIAANVNGDKVYDVMLEELKFKPRNLYVDDMTLVATWEAPGGKVIDENFETGAFPPAGWQMTYQSSVGWYTTTNGSSSYFSIPAHTKYAVANDDVAGSSNNGCCDMLITPNVDLTSGLGYVLAFQSYTLYDYGGLSTVEMSIANGPWTVIKTLDPNAGGWEQIEVDLSAYSGPGGLTQVKFAFHSDDDGQWGQGWAIDDIVIESGVIPVQGYGIFLDGAEVFHPIMDLTWTYDPTTINYGQTYVAGVAGIYSNGYSDLDTYTFTSHFLYPPRNLTATGFESAAILAWEAPVVGAGDSHVDASYPARTTTGVVAEVSSTVSSFVPTTTSPRQTDAAVLYDNGTIVNSPGTGPGGADESVILAGGTSYGSNFNQGAGFSLADDFVVPSNWTIQDVKFQGYQTNSGLTPSITGLYFRIYDGDPADGGTVVWGDLTTNRMTSIAFANIYRVNAPGEGTARPVMDVDCDGLNISLAPGTYWIEWQATGSASFSGPWVPNIVDPGNAQVFDGTSWSGIVNPGPVGMPFVLRGTGGGGGGGEPDGLVSYDLFRDDVLIANIPKTELQYFDLNLFPADYCYDIKAVYDLTSYGFPGTFGRSIKEGTACVNINYGFPVPFLEEWNTGLFSTNAWTIGQNWRMAGQMGNPMPAAEFGWDPPQTDYSLGMESAFVNSAALAASTSIYKIYLDFDLALADRVATSTEKMNVEIWNGTSWVSVGEFANAGDLAFTTQHIDITSKAKNRVFKVRFVASGEASSNIYYWLVDNIHVYYEFAPALNLMSVKTGTDLNNVHLTWEAPTGGGGSTGESFTEDFEGGVLPAGWLAIDNDGDSYNWINTIEQGFGFTAHSGDGAMTSASYVNGVGALNPDNWLITPAIAISDLSQLIYWEAAQDPNYADEQYYVKVSTTNTDPASFTTTIFDGITPDAWTEHIIDLSEFAGETIYIAFQHTDVTDMFYMKLDDITVTEIAGDHGGKSTTDLVGYNVYREGSTGGYAMIGTTTDVMYDDNNITPNDCYNYYVTVVYDEAESMPSNIRTECITVGINTVASSAVKMYPNPATSSVTVDLTDNVKQLTVYNYLGAVVLEKNIVAEKSVQLNTSDFAAGAYTVRFATSTGETFSKKLVIIK